MELSATNVPAPLRQFIEGLGAMVPRVVVALEQGGAKAGNWWIDLSAPKVHLSVEWHPERGFGVFDPSDDPVYGEQPVEFYKEPAMMLRRAVQLLDESEAGGIGLRELREIHSLSQAELASRLGVQQAAVSRVERRQDLHLDTLTAIIEALGGALELKVKFPNCEMPLKFRR